MMTQDKINLACGGVYIAGDGWLNFDYASSSSSIQKADLLSHLPLLSNTAALVYSSHFLELIPRIQVPALLSKYFRILKLCGVLRLVVLDLENLCRTYLFHRDCGEHDREDFLVLELLDQCLRPETGG